MYVLLDKDPGECLMNTTVKVHLDNVTEQDLINLYGSATIQPGKGYADEWVFIGPGYKIFSVYVNRGYCRVASQLCGDDVDEFVDWIHKQFISYQINN